MEFEFRPTSSESKVSGGVLPKGRFLIGRSESCDFIINSVAISAVHAVIEIFDKYASLYDMNSTNGTYVNDERIITKDILVGDLIRFADIEFSFREVVPTEEKPRILPRVAPSVSDVLPSIVYPLASDPRAEFSEYIYEDKDDLYPIFQYGMLRQAVEVIILFKDKIYSVDFLMEGQSLYHISGSESSDGDIVFPFLKRDEKLPFVEIQGKKITVFTLPEFSIFYLSNTLTDTGHQRVSIELEGKDLIRLHRGDLQIFIRNVHAPPKIVHAPFFKKDFIFQKYLILCLVLAAAFGTGVNLIKTPKMSINHDQASQRLASILATFP